MKTSQPTITTLFDLLVYDSQKILSAEIQLTNSLSHWTNRTGSERMKDTLRNYTKKIDSRIEKMEKLFSEENISPLIIVNKVMEALIAETEEKLKDCADAEVIDACILASVQEINHYKISVYGTAATFANVLNMESTAKMFHEAEVVEKQVDDHLSQIAQFEINAKAKVPILNA